MISGPNLEEQIEAAQTISSKTKKKKHDRQLMLISLDIAAGPYELWKKSTLAVPYLISLLDSDNMVKMHPNE